MRASPRSAGRDRLVQISSLPTPIDYQPTDCHWLYAELVAALADNNLSGSGSALWARASFWYLRNQLFACSCACTDRKRPSLGTFVNQLSVCSCACIDRQRANLEFPLEQDVFG